MNAADSELHEILEAMQAEDASAMREADVPPSGVVWWRIQRRLRQETTSVAMRAATVVQAFVVVAAIAMAVAIVGKAAVTVDWTSAVRFGVPLVLVTVACLTMAPLALYFVLRRD
jgi:hypothetical protein